MKALDLLDAKSEVVPSDAKPAEVVGDAHLPDDVLAPADSQTGASDVAQVDVPPSVPPCPKCDDGNPCTMDVCPTGTCDHPPADGMPCDDDNPCTEDDACVQALCEGRPLAGIYQQPTDPDGEFHFPNGLLPAPGHGWYIAESLQASTSPTGKILQGRVLRVDASLKTLWSSKGKSWPMAPMGEGIVVMTGGSSVAFLDADGKTTASYTQSPPLTNPRLLAVGSDVLLAGSLEDGAVVVRHLDSSGKSLGMVTWPAGVTTLSLAPGPPGNWLVAQDDKGPGNVLHVRMLAADLSTVQTTDWLLGEGQLDGSAALVMTPGTGPLLSAVLRKNVPPDLLAPGAIGGVVGVPGPDGKVAWLQRLHPSTDALWQPIVPTVVRLADGDVETLDGTQRLRFSPGGTLRWSRLGGADITTVQDQAEAAEGFALHLAVPVGVGVVYLQGEGAGGKPTRLYRTDAFGNPTCATSGPCAGHPASWCDDGNPCTNDRCDAVHGGCWHVAFAEKTPCKPGLSCKAGACQ